MTSIFLGKLYKYVQVKSTLKDYVENKHLHFARKMKEVLLFA